jgi:adenosylcobinamide-GDP ribazoletransferase
VTPVRDALRLAVGMLTVVRVRPPSVVRPAVAGRAMLLAPVAALPLAVASAGVLVIADLLGVPALPAAALAVGALALGSRGLHLDGLADTADGLASSYDRERALTVMRSGDVGPAGVATTVLVLAVQVGCLASLVSSFGSSRSGGSGAAALTAAVLIAVLLSRSVLPLACARGVPSARPSGLGATVAGSVPRSVAAAPLVVGAGLGSLLLAWAGLASWRAPVAGLLAAVVTAGVVIRCTRRLGGITGDVLGACVELSLAAALLALAAG